MLLRTFTTQNVVRKHFDIRTCFNQTGNAHTVLLQQHLTFVEHTLYLFMSLSWKMITDEEYVLCEGLRAFGAFSVLYQIIESCWYLKGKITSKNIVIFMYSEFGYTRE